MKLQDSQETDGEAKPACREYLLTEESIMSHEQRLIAVSHQLWEDLTQRAAEENLSAEGWLHKQLEDTKKEVVERRPDDAEEVLLDMTLSHFRGLKLSRVELRRVAAALFRTIDTGEPVQVGPVGRQGRRYRFLRRGCGQPAFAVRDPPRDALAWRRAVASADGGRCIAEGVGEK